MKNTSYLKILMITLVIFVILLLLWLKPSFFNKDNTEMINKETEKKEKYEDMTDSEKKVFLKSKISDFSTEREVLTEKTEEMKKSETNEIFIKENKGLSEEELKAKLLEKIAS